jgi:hypothetical protein
MTPSDLARDHAIAFECKKDGLRQTQAGTWKVTFTVLDMDERLTRAFPGTRYQAVLVEIGDDELPITQAAKEPIKSAARDPATPPVVPDKPRPEAKRMEWRELQPAAQAGIRCNEPLFTAFLRERYEAYWSESGNDVAECIRTICGVTSRAELGTNHKARVLWKQLDDHFQAWKLIDA